MLSLAAKIRACIILQPAFAASLLTFPYLPLLLFVDGARFETNDVDLCSFSYESRNAIPSARWFPHLPATTTSGSPRIYWPCCSSTRLPNNSPCQRVARCFSIHPDINNSDLSNDTSDTRHYFDNFTSFLSKISFHPRSPWDLNSITSGYESRMRRDFYRYANNVSLQRCIFIEEAPARRHEHRKQLNSLSPSKKNTRKKENHRRGEESYGEWPESRDRLAHILMLLLSL